MSSWNTGWRRTGSGGVYSCGGSWRIRVRRTDPRTGSRLERNRIVNGISLEDAVSARLTLRDELEQQLREPPSQRVAEFGRYWLRVKAPVIDPGTHARYRTALEDHAFRYLGRIDMRELRTMQVQEWINRELGRGYHLTTVKSWYRVLRTMTQDAIVDLDLNRDPCRRIRFPWRRNARSATLFFPIS